MKNKKNNKNFEILKLLLVGAVAGFVNGFFGAGGGLLIVPMLSLICGLDSKVAHATTLASVLLMCVSSSVVYFVKKQIDFWIVLWCVIGSVAGGIFGTFLLKKMKNNVIDLVFSVVLIAAGVLMIVF